MHGLPIEISAQAQEDLEATHAELQGKPGINVMSKYPAIDAGEQGGAIELLTVALSGGGGTAFVKLITLLVESRGSSFTLTIRRGKTKVELRADNASEALPLIKEMIDGS
jgi:hypothetical protein